MSRLKVPDFHQLIVLLILLCITAVFQAHAAEIKDSESATHGDDAARYQVVDTYEFPGFKVIQVNLPVLSHYSYLLVSGNEALVIDPGRDVTFYLDQAKKLGVRIKGVYLTHSHADFVAGHMEMAKAAGCPIYINTASGAQYTFSPLMEGSTIRVGEATLRILETPGHTPDGTCGAVYSEKSPDLPQLLFTGDTLFVGSVGRPDLMGGSISAAALASMAYDTWNNKLSKLPDSVKIFPAHGAGSLCGAHLSDQPTSTLGEEKRSNPYVRHTNRADFIAAVLDGLPEAPPYFKHNAAMNQKGPELIKWDAPLPEEVKPDRTLMDPAQYYVVDLRDPAQYAAGHIPNSVNIGARGRLETWVGIMVPWEAKLVVCGSPAEQKEAIHRLHRVGYRARTVSVDNWARAGLSVTGHKSIQPRELYDLMQTGESPVIVDVRLPNEWMAMRIGTVVNLPLNHLSELSSKLDPSQSVVTVCNSAYRSSMAAGILERRGFKLVSSLAGGSEAWIKAGLPVLGPERQGSTTPTPSRESIIRSLRLPERMAPAELKRLILDLPGTFELVDLRPSAHFADYSIPASRNVDIGDVMNNPAFLAGSVPLIIADRDGSLSMAVGGILSQKTQRPIKVLHGGVEAYWAESELKNVVREVMLPTVPGSRSTMGTPGKSAPSITPAVPPATTTPPAAPSPAKSKSAGC
jgi:glyoxylase-like metal-dependent hydrolase (beta-lactamase superfamily II)/rhodanese-related sulfurtransferase